MQTSTEHPMPKLRIPRPPLTRRELSAWWNAESGYRAVLLLAWPLFLAHGSSTILQFVDRMFLTWYNPDSMAAAGPSGMLAFTFQALFIGLTGYAATFVAQYTGANRPRQAIASVWQALYLSLFASILVMAIAPLAGAIFTLAGHPPAIQQMERTYSSILLYGSVVFISASAVSAYFIGKGTTQILLWASLVSVTINIILDYLLIFGVWGFPELGIAGAALASVIAQAVALLILVFIFLRESGAAHALHAWRPDFSLMKRVIRYGAANGIQFALDMVGWTAFLMLVGRLGVAALGASNLAFQLNTFAFFPIIGFAMAASILVGQNLGRNRPDLADRSVWSAIHISLLFTAAVALLYVLAPTWLIAPFAAQADPVAFAPVRELTIVMLRFIAAYCLFDVGNLVFASALKGAGDTLFVMLLSTSTITALMLLPTLLWCVTPGGLGVLGAWGFLTLAVCVLACAFLIRYLKGHWREMRVIERELIEL